LAAWLECIYQKNTKKEVETANVDVVIAGHMLNGSLEADLFLDELEKVIEVVPCPGLIRIPRA